MDILKEAKEAAEPVWVAFVRDGKGPTIIAAGHGDSPKHAIEMALHEYPAPVWHNPSDEIEWTVRVTVKRRKPEAVQYV